MQILRSSRGLLVVGGILAIVAFVLVVYLLENSSKSTPTPIAGPTAPVATVTPTLGTPPPTAVPTEVLDLVVAQRNVPADTKITDMTMLATYFKEIPRPSGAQVVDAVNSVDEWVNADTHVYSTTTAPNFLGTILIIKPIKTDDYVRMTDFTVLPMSPPGSLAFSIPPGRVAETVQISNLQADDLHIQAGDFVDVLLSIRQSEVDSLHSNPQSALANGATNWTGPVETQQLISDAQVVEVGMQTCTLAVSLQDAVLLKYAKDTWGTMDLVLVSSDDVKNQTVQTHTSAVFPEYFLTPEPVVLGTPQGPGVANLFITPIPTPTPTVPR